MAKGYAWPRTDAQAELISFLKHYRLRYDLKDRPMRQEDRNLLIQQMLEIYRPVAYELPDDFLEYTHFVRCVNRLNWNSSPGYEYSAMGYTTNRALFDVVDGEPSKIRMEAVYQQCMDLIRERKSNLIKVFIKPEPHTVKKIVQERYRLIYAVDIRDTLIDSMLFGEQNRLMVENHYRLPTAIGWTPLGGGWKQIPQVNVTATDVSAWDQCTQWWLLELLRDVRIGLCHNPNQLFKDLVHFRYEQLFICPRMVFSNGTVLQQDFPGIQKSGSFNTITDNSMGMDAVYLRVLIDLSKRGVNIPPGPRKFMGDDGLMSRMPKDFYELFGTYLNLKHVEPRAEFAGMVFNGEKVEPCYTAKHAFNLLHLNPKYDEEVVASYTLLYHRSNKRDWMRRMLKSITNPPPYAWADMIYG